MFSHAVSSHILYGRHLRHGITVGFVQGHWFYLNSELGNQPFCLSFHYIFMRAFVVEFMPVLVHSFVFLMMLSANGFGYRHAFVLCSCIGIDGTAFHFPSKRCLGRLTRVGRPLYSGSNLIPCKLK